MIDGGKVLITGGRGFIGTNLLNILMQSHVVDVFDNISRSSPTGWIDGVVGFHQADILDFDALVSAFKGVSKVVHLAAYGSVVESVSDPMSNFTINVEGTLNVLRAAVEAGVQRVVFASTGGALIGDAVPPVNEQSLPKPISPYGASKLCGEAYCHAFAKSYGLETVRLRFGNVYGPHSAHKKGAVTVFIKALMSGKPFVIYGDGSASRDYVYVEDLCAGIRAALDTPMLGGGVFHLASGQETTVLELAHMLRSIAGQPDHPIELRAARRGEVGRNFASFDQASEVLGFHPAIELRSGLKSTWQWFVDNKEAVFAAVCSDS